MKLDGFGTFQIAEEHLRVLSNDLSLPVFEFRPVRCFYNASLSQEVKMGLLLTRRSGAFLLSSIGPCVVLLLLGHLSFVAFPLHQFTDRASTSLSLLIVVAALFSQMSSTMPESAQPKAIDMWFFYCILRFFIFFVFHCIVDHHYKKSIEADKRQKESLASSKQQEALIFFKAPSLDSLKDPCEPADKGDNDKPYHHGRWVTEGKCSLPSITLPHPWLTPQLVNRMSLFFGVFQDLMFVVGFIIHLNTTNSFTKTQFYTFKDCSERGWRTMTRFRIPSAYYLLTLYNFRGIEIVKTAAINLLTTIHPSQGPFITTMHIILPLPPYPLPYSPITFLYPPTHAAPPPPLHHHHRTLKASITIVPLPRSPNPVNLARP
ncbi:hypothetical protein E2C01_042032 [Portunus trituberculatus]|uniref:Uncharacterized protein n=1 Tax=Portunus trituberculatus TaxID=210409 RepID=A0A5B7FVC4_PORTR|nr:hypothetical protein [Portunus trituberculatus]